MAADEDLDKYQDCKAVDRLETSRRTTPVEVVQKSENTGEMFAEASLGENSSID
jgi:hypothetical protein